MADFCLFTVSSVLENARLELYPENLDVQHKVRYWSVLGE